VGGYAPESVTSPRRLLLLGGYAPESGAKRTSRKHKMLFLAVFGWESAGMAGFLSKKIMDLKPEYWVGMLRIIYCNNFTLS